MAALCCVSMDRTAMGRMATDRLGVATVRGHAVGTSVSPTPQSSSQLVTFPARCFPTSSRCPLHRPVRCHLSATLHPADAAWWEFSWSILSVPSISPADGSRTRFLAVSYCPRRSPSGGSGRGFAPRPFHALTPAAVYTSPRTRMRERSELASSLEISSAGRHLCFLGRPDEPQNNRERKAHHRHRQPDR